MKHHPQSTSGPSAKSRRKASPDTEPMAVDPPASPVVPVVSTGRVPPDGVLSILIPAVKRTWKYDSTDATLKSDRVLTRIYTLVSAAFALHGAKGLVDVDQFKMNLTKESGSGFVDLLREAINGNNEELWSPVVTHDVFYTKIPDDLTSGENQVHRKHQEEAVTKSWKVQFIGDRVLLALGRHVIAERCKPSAYGPYCSIVQSSGMGKSRLLDEFSKNHFLIPVNLRRKETTGFPPPDDAIRDLLTQIDENGMFHFLIVLFEKTTRVITDELKGATSRSERITQFREFMTDGQTMASVGEKRRTFYNEIAAEVKRTTGSNHRDVGEVLDVLIASLGPRTDHSEAPDVFVAFDEAHSLVEFSDPDTKRTHFIHLRSALHALKYEKFFSFFLSTTSDIAEVATPRDSSSSDPTPKKTQHLDKSDRILHKELDPSLPFVDLGFDHLMHDRKIFDRYKTIEDVTSTECIVHMGRPLWGTLYDCGSEDSRNIIVQFAAAKLLCRRGDQSGHLDRRQEFSILSQRLALSFNSTAYATKNSTAAQDTTSDPTRTRKYDMLLEEQYQISNFMRVCVFISEDLVTMRGVAASEPILSEAASSIMRDNPHFNLPDALINILDSYAIDHGDRGELLVAAFFTRARDMYAHKKRDELFPYEPTRFCPTFSVKDLLAHLFHPERFSTMLDSLPSVCRAGCPPQKFRDVFGKTKTHFNHMIKAFEQDIITRPYLVSIMARGAAVLGANGQRGFDMVYPYLYDTSDLVINKVGFIIVQVKNYADKLSPNPELFRKIDPFACGLVNKGDESSFTVPIIRIVFSLGGKKPSLERMNYDSPDQGAVTLHRSGKPKFTSYDFWCSGIGPDLLQPVDEAQHKWAILLGKSQKWDNVFSASVDPDVRRAQYPGGGGHEGHYKTWMTPLT
ncbi:hypothetical protein EDB84DRAFT_1019205 [Lactarius hengduanensis]|nr:hypothetical protein EDB84DRAFT_1019205 [Lactarius hengduanensis]